MDCNRTCRYTTYIGNRQAWEGVQNVTPLAALVALMTEAHDYQQRTEVMVRSSDRGSFLLES